MSGNRQYRNVIAVAIEQAVDQVQVAWAARSGTDRQFS